MGPKKGKSQIKNQASKRKIAILEPDESVVESSVVDSEFVASDIPLPIKEAPVPEPPPILNVVPDSGIVQSGLNNNQSETTLLPKDGSKPVSLKDTIKKEKQLGFVGASGIYRDIESYQRTRSQFMAANNMEAVKETDLAWKEKLQQGAVLDRIWPPGHKWMNFFWTSGHYPMWSDKDLQSTGVQTTTSQKFALSEPPSVAESEASQAITKTTKQTEIITERGRRSVEIEGGILVKSPLVTPAASVIPESDSGLKGPEFSTHRLHVANIPLTATEQEVKKLFKNGTVELYPHPDGGQLLATVTFKDVKFAYKAFQESKKSKIQGKPLVVSPKLREE